MEMLKEILTVQNLMKYGVQGMAVAAASSVIPKQKLNVREVVIISVTAALTFAILDRFAPEIGKGARVGAGVVIGGELV